MKILRSHHAGPRSWNQGWRAVPALQPEHSGRRETNKVIDRGSSTPLINIGRRGGMVRLRLTMTELKNTESDGGRCEPYLYRSQPPPTALNRATMSVSRARSVWTTPSSAVSTARWASNTSR